MVFTGYDQKTPIASTLAEKQKDENNHLLAEALMAELDMGEKALPKANRLVDTLLTAIRRHVPFEDHSEILDNLPEQWQGLGEAYWQHIPYQERVKTVFPLLQEVIQQDQMESNFDILYTEEALALLQGFFRILRRF